MTTAVAIPLHQFHQHHHHLPHQPSSSRTTSMPGSSRPLPSSSSTAPPTSYQSSRLVGNAMQHHPPPQLRSRTSTTTVTRPVSPPIPPSLIDSPYIQNPNSPFRRDYPHAPAGPGYNIGHDRLNLLDTVPMGEDPKKYLEHRRGSLEPTELPPDDIGVAGAPKSARTSDMTTIRSTPRPGMVRGNSWTLQQQQQQQRGGGGVSGSYPPHPSYPSLSPSQSTVKQLPTSLSPQRFPPSNALPPISTPLPVPARYQQHHQPPPSSSSSNAASSGPSSGSRSISAATR